jgi:hypothetical protein
LLKSCLIWCYGRNLFYCYLLALSKAWFCDARQWYVLSCLYPAIFRGPVGLYLSRTCGVNCIYDWFF